jgi:hypothetical protein
MRPFRRRLSQAESAWPSPNTSRERGARRERVVFGEDDDALYRGLLARAFRAYEDSKALASRRPSKADVVAAFERQNFSRFLRRCDGMAKLHQDAAYLCDLLGIVGG